MSSSSAKWAALLLGCGLAGTLAAAVLSGSAGDFEFDDHTGRLLEMRRAGTVWRGSVDLYEFEQDGVLRDACELGDRVIAMEQPDADGVVYRCVNPEAPGVTITKTCRLDADGRLLRQVAFQSDTPGWLVAYFVAFRFAPELEKRHPVQDALLKDSGTIAATLSDRTQTLLIRRTGVNGRQVMRGEAPVRAAGWSRLRVMSDFLRVGEAVGGEVTYSFTPSGDYAVLLRELAAEYRRWTPRSVTADWSRDLLADVMYVTDGDSEFLELCRPYPVTGTIWFLNPPWGNWFADSDPPTTAFLPGDVRTIAPAFHAQFPHYRLAAYTNACIDDRSDLFRDHPEMLLRTATGQLLGSTIISDYQGRPSYLLRMNDPAVRDYMIGMHGDRTTGWGLDFFYTDGPGFFHEKPDWERREVVQNYHWLDYLEQLLAALRREKPDAVIFSNYFMPFSAVNYLEWRDPHWQQLAGKDWRRLATEMLGFKLSLPPWNTLVLTYGHVTTEPAFSAYTVFYGGAVHKPMVWRHPYALAALRTRGGTARPELLSPRWYDEEAADYEAVLFTCDDGRVIVNLLGHADVEEPLRLRWNARAAGLTPGKRYRAELLTVRPCEAEADNGAKITAAPFAFPASCPEEVEIALPVSWMTVQSLLIEEER